VEKILQNLSRRRDQHGVSFSLTTNEGWQTSVWRNNDSVFNVLLRHSTTFQMQPKTWARKQNYSMWQGLPSMCHETVYFTKLLGNTRLTSDSKQRVILFVTRANPFCNGFQEYQLLEMSCHVTGWCVWTSAVNSFNLWSRFAMTIRARNCFLACHSTARLTDRGEVPGWVRLWECHCCRNKNRWLISQARLAIRLIL